MTKLIYIVSCIIFFGINFLQAQGLLEDSLASPKIAQKHSATRGVTIPEKKSLRKYCPTPEQQEISSCVGLALGFAAMTISYAQHFEWKNQDTINQYAFSASFIYNQIVEKDSCEQGILIKKAGELLRTKGNILKETFKDNAKSCAKLPSEQELKLAQKSKIKDFKLLFGKENKANFKLLSIKKSLAQGIPIVVGFHQIPYSFYYLKKHTIYNTERTKTGFTNFGHALVVVGFDDRTESLELMNSWGTDWGNGGFCRISYAVFTEMVGNGYQVLIDNYVDPFTKLEAIESQLWLHPVSYKNGELVLDTVKMAKNPFHIYTSDKKYQLGDRFRLTTQNLKTGSFLYVFSIMDGDTTINLNFPTEGKSVFIPTDDRLTIPSPTENFTLTETGTDYLCVLLSLEEIPIVELEKRLENIADYQGNLSRRLKKAFEGLLVTDFEYHPNKLHLKTEPIAEGSAVFLILELSVEE